MSASPIVLPPGGQSVKGPGFGLLDTNNNSTSSVTSYEPIPDLAEQVNNEERAKYVKGKKLGEGTYAIVYKGTLRSDPSQIFAIKKIKIVKEYTDGLGPDAIRELKFLQELSHPNIIKLQTVFSSKDETINIVLEYLPGGDLEQLIRNVNGVRYGAADIKAWMGMISRAIWFCHENFVLHRDIKPNNLLIAADGEIKLADFGLARSFADPYRRMTSNVITRWYRPPELLFGAKHYSGAVDIWSIGCVFAELMLRVPYLASETEIGQINVVCQAIGTPTEENWPGVTKLPEYMVPESHTPVVGKDQYMARFGTAGPDGVDLLWRMLQLDPRNRITAREVLEHPWWTSEPRPSDKKNLPRADDGNTQGADLGRQPGQVADRVADREGEPKLARRLFQ